MRASRVFKTGDRNQELDNGISAKDGQCLFHEASYKEREHQGANDRNTTLQGCELLQEWQQIPKSMTKASEGIAFT